MLSNFRNKIPASSLLVTSTAFPPADKAHYDQDTHLVPFFRGLDQKNKDARNLNNGNLDYGGLQAILTSSTIDIIDRMRQPGTPFVGTFPAKLVSDEDMEQIDALTTSLSHPICRSPSFSASILRDDVTETALRPHSGAATLRLSLTLRAERSDARHLRRSAGSAAGARSR